MKPYALTCLHLASKNGSVECFKYLKEDYYSKRENVCFIDQCDTLGNTPLMLAVKFFSDEKPADYLAIIEELIKFDRFDINKNKNNDGDTLIHLICKNRFCPPSVSYIKSSLLKLKSYFTLNF